MTQSKKQPTKTKNPDDNEPEDMMASSNNPFLIVLVAVLLSFPIGFVVGASVSSDDSSDQSSTSDYSEHSHSYDSDSASPMAHSQYEVPLAEPLPAVEILVTQDPVKGWNLKLQLEHFTITPENANQTHIANEGHAHLYIDGMKVTRLYSSDYYLGELSEGQHTIKVTLNTNDHRDYARNGQIVEDSIVITDTHHAEESSDSHSH